MAETPRHPTESTPERREPPAPEEVESAAPPEEVEEVDLGEGLEEEVGAIVALAMMDAEAAAGYAAAAEMIDDDGIRKTILEFRQDHLRHVDDLNELIAERGGERVPVEPPAGPSLLVTLAQSLGALGTDEAMLSLLGAEQLTNSVYTTASELGLDERAADLIERNKRDEERHLEVLVDLTTEVDQEEEEES